MTTESPQNSMETEDLQLPSALVYEPVVRTVDRHDTANHLAFYVLRRWRRSIPKGVFRPPVGYLEPVCSMHVDIFYEILEHLHPIDLYHISQANRAFKALLSHPNSSLAWTLAFENDPALPKRPPVTPDFPTKMSGLEWAEMLFGRLVCQDCGKGAPANIPFRRFQCIDCAYSSVNDRLVDLECETESIRDTLVRKSQVLQLSERGHLQHTIDEWHRSEAEMNAVNEAILGYEDAIVRNKPGAKEAYDAYIAKRRAEVDPINEHAATCQLWAEELRKCYMNDLKRRELNIIKRVRSRFRRLGYHPEDVSKVTCQFKFDHVRHRNTSLSLSLNAPRLSNKRWGVIKPFLEPAVLRAKIKRRAPERAILINERKKFVHELYREYMKSVSPLTWPYLPPPSAVYEFKPFANLINAVHDDELDKASCEDALRLLPKEIEDWTLVRKRQLMSLLPGHRHGDITTSQQAGFSLGTSGPLQDPEITFNALQLATSVFCFRSGIGLCLIGWEEAGPHMRFSSMNTHGVNYWHQLYLSDRGHDAATALVRRAGQSPWTATTADMDRLDDRYICTSCPIVPFNKFKGREAYNWRDAVLHSITTGHRTSTWDLLTREARAHVKRREGCDPRITESLWSCALCPEHFKNMVPRKEAVKHVKFKHNIFRPVENTHFFYFVTRTDRTPRRPAGFPQAPSWEYKCKHCVSHSCLYSMKWILRHLRRSHQVQDPVAERDYVRVETVLHRSPLPMALPPRFIFLTPSFLD